LGAALTFALMVREQRFTPKPGLRLGASLAALPAEYRRFLVGVGLFGLGDFAHTLLILAATVALSGTWADAVVLGIGLYAWRNLCQAVAAVPAGWLGDHVGHVRVLVGGYVLGAITMAGFAALLLAAPASLAGWLVLFALAGGYMAIQEALEPAIVPEFVPDKAAQGTAFGVLAVVNGLGDVGASLAVGGLFAAVGPAAGLGYAAVFMLAGAAWLAVGVRRPAALDAAG
jgi:MFS family permease